MWKSAALCGHVLWLQRDHWCSLAHPAPKAWGAAVQLPSANVLQQRLSKQTPHMPDCLKATCHWCQGTFHFTGSNMCFFCALFLTATLLLISSWKTRASRAACTSQD